MASGPRPATRRGVAPPAGDVPLVRINCGPTGAGKSALAMRLAGEHGLAIVVADSRQVYRGFDLGTAKPTAAEQRRVPHWGIDLADPSERWSAARWATDASAWLQAHGASRAVVVGGTGLYLRALTAPFFEEPPLDVGRRAALAALVDRWPLERLRAWARRLDPARAHLGRTQLLRIIEVALLTGRRLSDLHDSARHIPRWRARWLVVDPGLRLHQQIEARLSAMLAAGWVDEARALAARVDARAPAWQACGYAAVRDVALGKRNLGEARTAILVHTRQYAKRQRTWFRHQLPDAGVTRVDPNDPGVDAAVRRWWSMEGSA
jgi:tRNA dimethylallyltransferase